jgi:cytochrome c oxidase subunit 4
MEHSEAHGHIVPYGTFLRVWLVLLGLTAALVFVSEVYKELLAVPAMLTITPLKAGIVFYYFMHLKYEKTFLKGFLFIALAALVVFLGLMFFDVGNR